GEVSLAPRDRRAARGSGAVSRMKRYRYVGPREIAAAGGEPGRAIASAADLAAWLRATGERVATFVVGVDEQLRLADRRSEHVACAGGLEVLAAGEMFFDDAGRVVGVSNQSTGFCPEVASWPAVAAALDRAGIRHPGRFTDAFEFRRCEACGER